jgi:EmrB/QacA subfamily drug resistance transporter
VPGFHGLAYHWQALICVVMGSFTVVLNMTIVNVALPRIIAVFQASVDQGQLVVTSYMVAMAIVIPAAGYTTDRFGAKRAYLVTLAAFTVGSALCGFAPTIEGLIFFRVLQGLGGGMVMTLGLTILFQAAPPNKRGSIMGVFGLPVLVAPMVGPIVGGYLVEFMSWRLIFEIAIPFGAVAVLAGAAILRESQLRPTGPFDFAGFALTAICFASALIGLYRAPTDGWTAPTTMALWFTMVVSLVALIWVELEKENPLLDLHVFLDRTFVSATLVSCVFMIGLSSASLLLSLFLQNVRGLGAFDTGLLLAPEALASGLMMPIAGRLLDRLGPRPLAIPGLIALAVAFFLLGALDPSTPDDVLRPILVLRGLAMGMAMMPAITVAMDTIPAMRMARATATGNALRQISGAFGTAFAATILIERQVYHEAMITQTTVPTSVPVLQVLSANTETFIRQGFADGTAGSMALAMLARQVSQAATVRAYDDCFVIVGAMMLVGLIPAVLIRRTRRR